MVGKEQKEEGFYHAIKKRSQSLKQKKLKPKKMKNKLTRNVSNADIIAIETENSDNEARQTPQKEEVAQRLANVNKN